jgi:hypothetical protein
MQILSVAWRHLTISRAQLDLTLTKYLPYMTITRPTLSGFLSFAGLKNMRLRELQAPPGRRALLGQRALLGPQLLLFLRQLLHLPGVTHSKPHGSVLHQLLLRIISSPDAHG